MDNRRLITHNTQTVLQLLLQKLKIPDNNSWYDDHTKHPDYPSFASIHYLLHKRGIPAKAFQATYEELQSLPSPLLVHIRENGGTFLLLEKTDENQVYIINEKQELETNPVDYFKNAWDGNVMIFDSEHIHIPPENSISRIKRIYSAAIKPVAVLSALLLLTGVIIHTNTLRDPYSYLYLAAYSVGLLISVLFLIRQFEPSNTLIDKICHTKTVKKADCSSILDTRAAYFMGIFSWSDFGFVYFASLFLLTLFSPAIAIPVSAISSLLSFPYVFYSIGYQWQVAKSWCMLCLFTQAVLSILFIITLFALPHFSIHPFYTTHSLYLIAIPLVVISLYSLLKPVYQSHLKAPNLIRQYNSLKHDDLYFESAFSQQQEIDTATIEKITLYPEGKDSITVIFNPTCTPCMAKLPALFNMLSDKTNTRLEMIYFLDPNRPQDESYILAKSLLSAYEKSPEQYLKTLNDYAVHYPDRKAQLKKQFPIKPENDLRMSQYLNTQNEWCLKNKIYATPMVFFNNKKLPDIYTIHDLDYHCS